jgi:hypothetical protein
LVVERQNALNAQEPYKNERVYIVTLGSRSIAFSSGKTPNCPDKSLVSSPAPTTPPSASCIPASTNSGRCASAPRSKTDPRYTPTTTFETFPFPAGLTPRDTAPKAGQASPPCMAGDILAETSPPPPAA